MKAMSSNTRATVGSIGGPTSPFQGETKKSSSNDSQRHLLMKGWIARESNVVEHLLNKRYAKLYPTSFMTFRKESDEQPSKIWPITRSVDLTPVEEGDYQLRHSGTSTLLAIARGKYDTLKMWAFIVTWTGLVGGQDKLRIAFEAEDEAQAWHTAFSKAIAGAPTLPPASRQTPSNISTTSVGTTLSGLTANSTMQAKPEISELDMDDLSDMNDRSRATNSQVKAKRKQRGWTSVLHINGMSVYVEDKDEAGDGGGIMASTVVRAPPKDVFKHLVQVRKSEGLGIFIGARTVEVLDNTTQVVTQQWHGAGVVASLCSPREMVLLRTWRKDIDGTYIVLYQSTNHRSVRKSAGWSWRNPVRANVQAAGFTIAPLLPQYYSGTQSPESLVTMVLKADLGGFLSQSSIWGRYTESLAMYAGRGILEPIITSLVVLRDHVEQNRFVVRPLTLSHGEEIEGEEISADVPTERGGITRTTTMIIFDRDKSLAQAQEEAGAGESSTLKAEPSHLERIVDESWAISGTCLKKYWSSPGNCGFKVRGHSYLTDKKKIPAALPLFELVAVDLLELDEPIFHICKHLPSVKHSPAPFLFCVQLMVPSSPPVSLVCVWASPIPILGRSAEELITQYEKEQSDACPENVAAFFRNLTEFLDGDDEEANRRRNTRFKLIPRISKGSWVIKQSVGTTPVILGTKLSTKYYWGDNYFEADVDIGASSVAASITNLVCGATKSLTLDMGILLEGQDPRHLPEQLLGTIRLDQLDLKSAAYFDETLGKVIKPDILQRQ